MGTEPSPGEAGSWGRCEGGDRVGIRETSVKPLPGATRPPPPSPHLLPPSPARKPSRPGRGGGPCGCSAHCGRKGALQRVPGGRKRTWKSEVGGNTFLGDLGGEPCS